MEFKIDIRFLVLSLLLHLTIFSLIKLQNRSPALRTNQIEVTLENNNQNPKISVPKLKEHPDLKENNNSAHFMSDQIQRFKKETISQNLGVPQNQKAQRAQKKNNRVAKNQSQKKQSQDQFLEHISGPSYLSNSQSQENMAERQSAINFELPNISRGEFTFLNSDFSTYAAFYNRITPVIMYHWGNNIQDIALFAYVREMLQTKRSWTTRIDLTLDKSGHYLKTMIEKSSGSPELDQAIVGALKNSSPYMNPPTGMIDSENKVHIEGEFTVYTQRPQLAQ